jgi:hypothetical protein
MKMKASFAGMAACLSLCLVAAAQAPALCQNYHANYGGSRVINQGQTGLANPSGTYIGPGTMSQSARGLPPGGSSGISNPGLPRVNMGANIRTPGDNMYTQKPATQRQANPGLPRANYGANIGTPGDNMRSDLHYYVPGQNNVQQRAHPNQPPGVMYKPGSRGAATYAEQNYSTTAGARRF